MSSHEKMEIMSLRLLHRGHTPLSELLFLFPSGGSIRHSRAVVLRGWFCPPPQEMFQQCLESFLVVLTGWVEARAAAEHPSYRAPSDPVPNLGIAGVERPCLRDKEGGRRKASSGYSSSCNASSPPPPHPPVQSPVHTGARAHRCFALWAPQQPWERLASTRGGGQSLHTSPKTHCFLELSAH